MPPRRPRQAVNHPRTMNWSVSNARLANMNNNQIKSLLRNIKNVVSGAWQPNLPNNYSRTNMMSRVNKLERVLANRNRNYERERKTLRGRLVRAPGAIARGALGAVLGASHHVGKALAPLKPWYNKGVLHKGGFRIGVTRLRNLDRNADEFMNQLRTTPPNKITPVLALGPNFRILKP